MRTYTKTKHLAEQLNEIIAKMRDTNDCFLPSERKLCEMLKTSRVTLRKALKKLEDNNVLLTGSKSRLINGTKPPCDKGKIVFVAAGVNGITNHAWHRLWEQIERNAEARGYQTTRELHHGDAAKLNTTSFKNYHYIIFANGPSHIEHEFCSIMEGKSNVITVSDNFTDNFQNVVALDNYAVGCKAAEHLLASGYKAPGFIGWKWHDNSFKRRLAGFVDTLNSANVAPRMVEWLEGNTLGGFIKNFLFNADKLITTDIDSLFVYSDEGISLFYDTIAHIRKVPEDFGLITVNGSHQALMHYPPITSIAHATKQTANEIFNLIEKLEQGKYKKGKKILLKPGVHQGLTTK